MEIKKILVNNILTHFNSITMTQPTNKITQKQRFVNYIETLKPSDDVILQNRTKKYVGIMKEDGYMYYFYPKGSIKKSGEVRKTSVVCRRKRGVKLRVRGTDKKKRKKADYFIKSKKETLNVILRRMSNAQLTDTITHVRDNNISPVVIDRAGKRHQLAPISIMKRLVRGQPDEVLEKVIEFANSIGVSINTPIRSRFALRSKKILYGMMKRMNDESLQDIIYYLIGHNSPDPKFYREKHLTILQTGTMNYYNYPALKTKTILRRLLKSSTDEHINHIIAYVTAKGLTSNNKT
jgi:hypothetical protein